MVFLRPGFALQLPKDWEGIDVRELTYPTEREVRTNYRQIYPWDIPSIQDNQVGLVWVSGSPGRVTHNNPESWYQ